jgi:hypothetical protein
MPPGKKKPVQEEKQDEEEKSKKEDDEVPDLFTPEGFQKALRKKVARPFIFGPVEFDGLDISNEEQPFDFMNSRAKV